MISSGVLLIIMMALFIGRGQNIGNNLFPFVNQKLLNETPSPVSKLLFKLTNNSMDDSNTFVPLSATGYNTINPLKSTTPKNGRPSNLSEISKTLSNSEITNHDNKSQNAVSNNIHFRQSEPETIHPEIESTINWLNEIHGPKGAESIMGSHKITDHFLVIIHETYNPEIINRSQQTNSSNSFLNNRHNQVLLNDQNENSIIAATGEITLTLNNNKNNQTNVDSISLSNLQELKPNLSSHERAQALANKYRLRNLGQVKHHPHHYHFILPLHRHVTEKGTIDQFSLSPEKSDDLSFIHTYDKSNNDNFAQSYKQTQSKNGSPHPSPSPSKFDEKRMATTSDQPNRSLKKRSLISDGDKVKRTLEMLRKDPEVREVIPQHGFIRRKRGYKALDLKFPSINSMKDPTDPLFTSQWYLKNTGQNGGKPYLDLNVESAWAQGCTGKNITTAIMDDGVDYKHPDLKDNYNAKASYDFSSNDPYPYPRYTDDWFNSHGTRCAGEISSKRDNGICGVGIAYDSLIAGIRMLDQPYMTDLIEANSMGHEPNLIDIYSASWGPTDDGKTVDGPRNLTMRAIVKGVNEGRNGLGNIYVWASGDGGKNDDCNCDGYAASMWTVSINSAINTGENARYDESCSSTLASTFSNGGKNPNSGVATTDLYGKCTKTHSGTSAAAPEAAGVFALALEANPSLTWRDIQHLTVFTSKRNSLYDSHGEFPWTMNGVGLEFNHLFGYGILDAGAMVALAKEWKSVPSRFHCEAGSVKTTHVIPSEGALRLYIDTNSCDDMPNEVNFLEHVQCIVTLNSTRRGDVTIFLVSPSGTRSMLLGRRPNDDDAKDGFYKWPFMTTHTWGENPRGRWILEINIKGNPPETGHLKQWTLLMHGTKDSPYEHQRIVDPKSKLAIAKKAHDLSEERRR